MSGQTTLDNYSVSASLDANPGGAFMTGTYSAALYIDGVRRATTSLTVGLRAPSRGNPAVTAFYPTSLNAYRQWLADRAPRPRPPKTVTICFYIKMKNVVPKVTKLQVAIYDASDKFYAWDAQVTPLYTSESKMVTLAPHTAEVFDGGAYQAGLWLDGKLVLLVPFTVEAVG